MEENITLTEQAETPATEQKTFTQEEVNDLIGKRLEKAEKKWADKYSNYFSADDVKTQTEDLNKQLSEIGSSLKAANDKSTVDAQTIADLESKVKKYETDSAKIRVALEVGIPYELANKLDGETEEEIKADAQKLLPFVTQKQIASMRNAEAGAEVDGVTAAFRALNPNLKF